LFEEFLGAIDDKEARRRLGKYLGALQRWSKSINLTAANTPQEAVDTLILPVLGSERCIQGDVIDVGSGNGSPGLILAALLPTTRFTLLEPRAKRWAFLRDATRDMGLANVTVSRQRSDQYTGQPAKTITMRAVGLAPEALRALSTPGGAVLVFGGPTIAQAEKVELPSGALLQRYCFT